MGVLASVETGEAKTLECETVCLEYKEVTPVQGMRGTRPGTREEETALRDFFCHTKYTDGVNKVYDIFKSLLERVMPKVLACALNGAYALKIVFGVLDNGTPVGFPIKCIETTTQMILHNLRLACQLICKATHNETKQQDALYAQMIDLLVADITYTPVTLSSVAFADCKCMIEREIQSIMLTREEKKPVEHRHRHINKKAHDIINSDMREQFLCWLKYSKHSVICDLEQKYPAHFSALYDKLNEKKDGRYKIVDVDTFLFRQNINDTTEEKLADHILVVLIGTYKDALKQLLKAELKAETITTPELKVRPTLFPLLQFAKRRRLELMKMISGYTDTNMYTCSISLNQRGLQHFLHNVRFLNLAENGFLLSCGNNVCLLTRGLDKYNKPTTVSVVVSTHETTLNCSNKRKQTHDTEIECKRICV